MPHRRDRIFIAQMVEAAEAALEFSNGHSTESFAGDRRVGYAVVPRARGRRRVSRGRDRHAAMVVAELLTNSSRREVA
jgi:hypothetical protein